MKTQVLFRQIHHWGSIILALPLVIMIGAGILLMLKKEVDWIQPPTQRGAVAALPSVSLEDMFKAAQAVPEAAISDWRDLDRVDFKPGKGVVKFVGDAGVEVQVDTSTGQVLQVAVRRSDVIEAIHDGSYFADWVKLYVFLPAGVLLFILWVTGLYLFILPHWKKAQKKKAKRLKAAAAHPAE